MGCENDLNSESQNKHQGRAFKMPKAYSIDLRPKVMDPYYLDETGFCPGEAHGQEWSAVGERCYLDKVGSIHSNQYSVISAYHDFTLVNPMLYKGTLTKDLFLTYLDRVLLPVIPKQSILVMDNLSCHKGRDVDELCVKHSVKIVYLPPLLAPIEPHREMLGPHKT